MARVTAWTSATIPYVTTDKDTSTWNNDTVYIIRNTFEQDGKCTGIARFGESVVSFDEQNMYVWDPASPTWSKVKEGFGCVNHRTVQVVDGWLLWANRSGMYRWDGGELDPVDITEKIRDRVNQTGLWDIVDPTKFGEFCAGVKDNQGLYYLSVGTLLEKTGAAASQTPNAVLVFDTRKEAWVYRSYPEQIMDFTHFTNAAGDKYLCAITDAAMVIQLDTDSTTDAKNGGTEAIAFNFQTQHRTSASPSYNTKIEFWKAKYISTNSVTVSESVDRGAYGSLATLAAAAANIVQEIKPAANRVGYTHSLEFSGTGRFILEGYGWRPVIEPNTRRPAV